MKIHNNLPVSGKTTRKNARSRTDGVFGRLLESEMDEVRTVRGAPSDVEQPSIHQAWQSLEDSVNLLDRAMQYMQDGSSPSPQLINDIDQLRQRLHQLVCSSNSSAELRQADTLLAVEAERIRAMHA